MKHMMMLLQSLVFIYIGVVALMFVFQRQLMYLPDRNIGSPSQYGLQDFRDARAFTSDHLSIQVWYRAADAGFPTIVYFHGNAGNLGNRSEAFATLAGKGFGVLGVSYRGYGLSEGKPHETGIYHDARAAIDYLKQALDISPERLLLYGESLGSGVAVQMATEFPVAGVILEAPYTSVASRAAEIYYYIPVRHLIRDRFDSLSKINRIGTPLLLFHGKKDQVIPVAHGKKLFRAAMHPKKAHFLPDIGHNDFDRALISEHVLAFAKKHHLITQ